MIMMNRFRLLLALSVALTLRAAGAADAVCQLQGTFLDNAHAGTGDAAASVVIRGGTVKFLGLEAALGFPGNGTHGCSRPHPLLQAGMRW